jgi:hypothetical protein
LGERRLERYGRGQGAGGTVARRAQEKPSCHAKGGFSPTNAHSAARGACRLMETLAAHLSCSPPLPLLASLRLSPSHYCIVHSTPAPLHEEFIPQGGGERFGPDLCMQRVRCYKRSLVPKCLPLAAAASPGLTEAWGSQGHCVADPTPEEGEASSLPCVAVQNPIGRGLGHVLSRARLSSQG